MAGCLSDSLEFFARAADRLKVGEVLKPRCAKATLPSSPRSAP